MKSVKALIRLSHEGARGESLPVLGIALDAGPLVVAAVEADVGQDARVLGVEVDSSHAALGAQVVVQTLLVLEQRRAQLVHEIFLQVYQ